MELTFMQWTRYAGNWDNHKGIHHIFAVHVLRDISTCPQDDRSALYWASFKGHTGVVSVLLDHGAEHAVDKVYRNFNKMLFSNMYICVYPVQCVDYHTYASTCTEGLVIIVTPPAWGKGWCVASFVDSLSSEGYDHRIHYISQYTYTYACTCAVLMNT